MTDTVERRALTREQLLSVYKTMRAIREFEERVHAEFATGEIPGFVHLYAGEEASAVGVCSNLDGRDTIASTHRGHGHCIAKGVDVSEMMAEIYGRRTGSCHGKGGSMHIADLAKGMLGANGIVGGGVAAKRMRRARAAAGEVAVATTPTGARDARAARAGWGCCRRSPGGGPGTETPTKTDEDAGSAGAPTVILRNNTRRSTPSFS